MNDKIVGIALMTFGAALMLVGIIGLSGCAGNKRLVDAYNAGIQRGQADQWEQCFQDLDHLAQEVVNQAHRAVACEEREANRK